MEDNRADRLKRMASASNQVWNQCNEWSSTVTTQIGEFLSDYDLNNMTAGWSKQLGLHSQTVQAICKEYVKVRKQFKKVKLKWRSYKRSLGWIPFKASAIKYVDDSFMYMGVEYKVWMSRQLPGAIKGGSFTQDARGRWYINVQCEVITDPRPKTGKEVGGDLGLKNTLTLSDGMVYNHAPYAKHEDKLKMSHRANKKKLSKTIHAKIKNTRNDYWQKVTTIMVSTYDTIYVGNVSSKKMKKTRFAKSVSDNAWATGKTMLEYKAKRLGVDYRVVDERFSTVTCSICLHKNSALSGLGALGVREWTCKNCGHHHNRDVNAAQNILRMGHHTPLGNPLALA